MAEVTKFDKIFKRCSEELERKNTEYGEVGEDYSDMAAFEGRKTTEVCFSLLMKHITVLKKISRKPENFPLKLVEHRVMDAINFLCVFQNEVERYIVREPKKQS